MTASGAASLVGRRLTLSVGDLVHGGHCLSRHEGRVVFVRHALPGERVVAEVTEGDESARYLRADAVEVLEPSADRVSPRCRLAHPGGCGGCDFQHVDTAAQRRMLAKVVAEQLRRIAGLDVHVEVETVPGDQDGLGWRTRVRFTTDDEGRLGLRKHRSHDVVPVETCPIAHPDLPPVTGRRWAGASSVEVVVSGSGARLVVIEPEWRQHPDAADVEAEGVLTTTGHRLRGRAQVTEHAAGRDWRVSAAGFWQVHPGAADALVSAVLQMLEPVAGDSALDLYSGVGLFAGALGERVGTSGSVLAVESHARAVRDARRNLHGLPQVRLRHGRVERVLAERPVDSVDLVVLDPPRVGLRRDVVQAVVGLRPRAVCYVACDPAALARDLGILGEHGYELTGLRAFDIFPMTHHVECVALCTPRRDGGAAQG
jgi:tRNA/tmRNA/rRNA uracil-C5-methylase (TrmA/RlmC/RlmD family)